MKARAKYLFVFSPPLCLRVSLTSYSTKNKIISCLSVSLAETDGGKGKMGN
jgi:hypothetical protein